MKFKNILFLSITSFIIASAQDTTEVNLTDKFSGDRFKFYNVLPEVELANQKLHESHSFEQFLAEARELAQLYNLEESMGIRLIHRHTDINDDEIMVEKHEYFEGQDALVTRPQNKTHENEAAPASWIFNGEQYHAFEYSNDAYVSKTFEILQKSPEFLIKFASILKKYDYQNLIALAITDREWYQNYVGKHSFLERSYEVPTFASVVVNSDGLEDIDSINTAWSFKIDPITLYCAMRTQCISTPAFGHMKYTSHQYVVAHK